MNPGTITFLKAVLDASWQGSLVILLVLLIRPLLGLRVPARWKYMLWSLVLIRLLIPAFVLPRSPASLQNIPAVQRPIERAQVSLDNAYTDYVIADETGRQTPQRIELAGQGETSAPLPPARSHKMPWWEIAAGTWFCGAALFAAWIIGATIRLHLRLARENTAVDEAIVSVWKSCCSRFPMKHPPRLLATRLVDSPALVGVLRPALLVPAQTQGIFSAEDWEHIFMHELAHFRRRDHWTQVLQLLALCAHWFNPLVWLGFRFLRADRELAADELALKRLSGDRAAAYGDTLLKVLSGRSTISFQPGLVGIMESGSQLKQRLRRIVAFGPRQAVGSAVGLGLVIVLAAVVLGRQEEQADISAYDGMKPDAILVLAAKKGDMPVARKMLDDGAGINSVVSIFRWEKKTPLSSAAAEGRMDVVKFLLSKGALLNPAPDGTHSAVGFALANGWIDCADFLVSKGAAPEPIAFAAAKGDRDAIDKMLAGPQPDFDELKFLATIAAVNGHRDIFSDLSDALRETGEYVQWDSSVAVTVIARDHRDVFEEMGRRDASVPRGVARYAGAASKTKGMRDWLIAKGCKIPDYTDDERLIDAAEYQDLPEMRRLIKAGANVNYAGEAGWTPLAKASAWGQPLAVKLLLENKANPNSLKSSVYSALCLTESPEIADMLLAAGADLHGKPDGEHNIDYAVACCPDEMVKWYLDHGLDPTKEKGNAYTPTLLFTAKTPGIAEMLIAHGVDVNAKNEQGQSAIFVIEQMQRHPAKTVGVLLKHGADPNLKAKGGYTPLMGALDGETVDALIAAGADPTAKNDSGVSVLDSYVPRADSTRLSALSRRLKPGPKDGAGMLINAIHNGDARGVESLLKAGTDPNATDKNAPGLTPLDVAVSAANWRIVDILRKAGANDMGLFTEAVAKGDLAQMKVLMGAGADVNESDSGGDTPLHLAVGSGRPEMVEFLLDHGSNINLFNKFGETPYTLAKMFDWNIKATSDWSPLNGMSGKDARKAIDAILALFDKQKSKLDVNYVNNEGETLLFPSAASGDLVTFGAFYGTGQKFNANLQRKDGMTALMVAVATQPRNAPSVTTITDPQTKKAQQFSSRGEIVKDLLQLGADLSIKNNDGKTALDLAKENGNEEILSLLQQGK